MSKENLEIKEKHLWKGIISKTKDWLHMFLHNGYTDNFQSDLVKQRAWKILTMSW